MSLHGPRSAYPAAASAAIFLIWLGVWQGIAAPPDAISPIILIIVLWIPILPAIPLIFQGNRRAATWCSLIGVFYFGFTVMELVANPVARPWAAIGMFLCALMVGLQLRLIRSRPDQRH